MSPAKIAICAFMVVSASTGNAGALIQSATTPLQKYVAGAIVPIYIHAASDVVGGTATLQMTSPYGVLIKPLMTLDLLNGQYLHRWYSEGYLPGNYVFDATFTAPDGQQEFLPHALTISLKSSHDFVLPVDVNPKEVRPGDKVDLSVVALDSFLLPPGFIDNASLSVRFGTVTALDYTRLRSGLYSFPAPTLAPGEYPITLTLAQFPHHEFRATQKISILKPLQQYDDWSASWNIKVATPGDDEGSQISIRASTNGDEVVLARASLYLWRFQGQDRVSTSIGKVPMRSAGSGSFELNFSTEGFDVGTSCKAEFEFLMQNGEVHRLDSDAVGPFGNTPTTADVCRRNLALIQAAKFAWAFDHNTWIPGCHDTESLNWFEEPDMSDLSDYLKPMPICPEGGEYSPNRMYQLPDCSIGDHGTGSDTHWTQSDDHILHRWGNQGIMGETENLNGKKCSENLARMERAKNAWAYEANRCMASVPASPYLMQYLSCRAIPECPSSGAYGLGSTGSTNTPSPATCSLSTSPGYHAMDYDSGYGTDIENEERRDYQFTVDRAQMRIIQKAKIQWALANGKGENDRMTIDEVLPYLPGRRMPVCTFCVPYELSTVGHSPYAINDLDASDLAEPGMSLHTPTYDPHIQTTPSVEITNITTIPENVADSSIFTVTADVFSSAPDWSPISRAQLNFWCYGLPTQNIEMIAEDGAFDSQMERITGDVIAGPFVLDNQHGYPQISIFAWNLAGGGGWTPDTYLDAHSIATDPIRLLEPDGFDDVVTGATYEITWLDSNDSNIPIELVYLQSDDFYFSNSQHIISTNDQYPSGLTVFDSRNAYSWDVSTMPSGVYYIGARILREKYTSRIPELSLGPITIRRDDPTPLPTMTVTPTPSPTETPAPTETPTPTPIIVPTCPPNPDLNSDGIVDATDLMIFGGYWHETGYVAE